MPEAGEATMFKKSSRSMNNAACVEVAVGRHRVAVRDSKAASGPVLEFSPAAWSAFIADIPVDRLS